MSKLCQKSRTPTDADGVTTPDRKGVRHVQLTTDGPAAVVEFLRRLFPAQFSAGDGSFDSTSNRTVVPQNQKTPGITGFCDLLRQGANTLTKHEWAEKDSNLRRLTPADLQSAPFDHLGIHPTRDRPFYRVWPIVQRATHRPSGQSHSPPGYQTHGPRRREDAKRYSF